MATTPVSEVSERSTVSHSRNHSDVSSTTLYTNAAPYEPLLPPICQSSSDAYEVISNQSRRSGIRSLARWSQNNIRSRSASVRNEKASNMEDVPRSRTIQLRWIKSVIETIMILWSVYSMGRYLFAFTIYESLSSQLASLILGICTGLSFAFVCCSIIFSIAQKRLLIRGVPIHSLEFVRSLLHYLSSVCFLSPSIANFCFVVAWRNTSNFEVQFHHRCKLDIDLVWSITYSLCDHVSRPWGVWVTLAIIRIFLSMIVLVVLHIISFSPVITIQKACYVQGSKSHQHLPSNYSLAKHPSSKASLAVPPLNRVESQRSTEYSLSNKSSPRHRLRSNQSRSSERGPCFDSTDFLPMDTVAPANTGITMTFIERFRALVSQIVRETEEGIAFARSDVASTSYHSNSSAESPTLNDAPELDIETSYHSQFKHSQYNDDDDDDDFYSASGQEGRSAGYQEYPAEEHIRMMNGYLKRMPTIESMGSHELGSLRSVGASLNTNHERNEHRSSTRNTIISWNGTEFSGSDPRRSLTAQAELLVGMFGKTNPSEIGELSKPGDTVKLVGGPLDPLGDYDSSTSGSKDTSQSFHTASSGIGTVNSQKTDTSLDETDSPADIPQKQNTIDDSEV